MDRRLVRLIILCTLSYLFISSSTAKKSLVPALFIFGDSIVYSGNNKNLKTRAVGNHPPNGIDFPGKTATGRFTNGYTIADLFDKMLNLPLALSYVSTKHIDRLESTSGYNYASTFTGILPETGRYLSDHYNSSRLYKHDEYADLLVKKFGKYLKDLDNLGARKFVVFQIPRIGCYPELVEQFKPDTKCADGLRASFSRRGLEWKLEWKQSGVVVRCQAAVVEKEAPESTGETHEYQAELLQDFERTFPNSNFPLP